MALRWCADIRGEMTRGCVQAQEVGTSPEPCTVCSRDLWIILTDNLELGSLWVVLLCNIMGAACCSESLHTTPWIRAWVLEVTLGKHWFVMFTTGSCHLNCFCTTCFNLALLSHDGEKEENWIQEKWSSFGHSRMKKHLTWKQMSKWCWFRKI